MRSSCPTASATSEGQPIAECVAAVEECRGIVALGHGDLVVARLGRLGDGYLGRRLDLELLQESLGRIGPARIKNDYRARCSKSGRRFIVEVLQDINDHPMGTNSATAMQKIIDGMLTAGCEATVASFLALTEKVRVWNKCQVKAKILPEDQLAEKFKDLVIRMGEVAENKLQITINNAVMQTMVRKGDVDAAMPKIIIDSCCIVLGDLEGKQLVSELEGKALLGRDRSRRGRAGGSRATRPDAPIGRSRPSAVPNRRVQGPERGPGHA